MLDSFDRWEAEDREERENASIKTFYQGIEGIELKEMKIEECPKMKSMIRSSSADIDDSLHLLICQPQKVSFRSLEKLTITNYIASTSIFTLSMARNLVSLRELYIRNCDEMIKVIEDEQQEQRILVFPKLEELELQSLPKLVSICDWKCEVELPLLRKVEIYDCPSMENLSLGLVATPNLEAFTTDLTTYVGVGVDVSFDSLKALTIQKNVNPWYDDKISVSLFNGLEKLIFYDYKGGMSLFSSSTVGNLVNLRVLQISYCDKIVKVIEDDGKVVVKLGLL